MTVVYEGIMPLFLFPSQQSKTKYHMDDLWHNPLSKNLYEFLNDEKRYYQERNYLLLLAANLAKDKGYTVGVQADPNYVGLPAVYIELPTGQTSWHLVPDHFATLSKLLPEYEGVWDRHSTEEKHLRICEFLLSKAPCN